MTSMSRFRVAGEGIAIETNDIATWIRLIGTATLVADRP